jgi:hypothetical protein
VKEKFCGKRENRIPAAANEALKKQYNNDLTV